MVKTYGGKQLEQPLTKEVLLELLQQIYLDYDTKLHSRFKRSLPFQDTIFDRWERASRLGFAENVSIYNSASIYGEVSVGASTWIGPNVLLDGSGGGITIGRFCSISSGVHIYTHDTVLWALSSGKYQRKERPVIIGNNVYVGSQSVISLGVTVGNTSVIGANSFVNRDVSPFSIVAGSPARVIGRVIEEDDTMRLEYNRK